MKNKAKRIVSALCALAMFAAMVPAAAFAEEPGTGADASQTPSTMMFWDWLEDAKVDVGATTTITGSRPVIYSHCWTVVDGNFDCVELSNTKSQTVTVTGLKEGWVVLRHEYGMGNTEYVKVCVTQATDPNPDPDPNPNPDPEPTEEEGIYFYVAIPDNSTLNDDKNDYRFLTYGGTVSDLASHDMQAVRYTDPGADVQSYIATYPTELNVGYPNKQGIDYNVEQTSLPLDDVESNTWTVNPTTGEISAFSFTINGKEYTSDEYGLRWAKFSVADTTDILKNTYHADLQLYNKATVNYVLSELNPQKKVEDFVLDSDGQDLTEGTFSFVLKDSNNAEIAELTATVDAENTGVILVAAENANTVLGPGNYTISEVQTANDLLAWEAADSISFTVNSDATVVVAEGEDKVIINTPALYTVTYDDGIEDPEAPAEVPDAASYKYNFNYTVADAPTRDGYTFAGWKLTYDENDGVVAMSEDDSLVQPGDNIQIQGNVTLTAQWTEKTVDPGFVPSEGNVEINKTATDLKNDQADVTLSVGASEGKDNVAVLFVLDYSTSVGVRQTALDMLQELASKENTNVKVGVVNYWADAQDSEWIDMKPDLSVDDLLESPQSNGTNLHAGLLKAKEMLKDPAIDGYETYLIVVSDGITYLWTDESTGETKSAWFQNVGNGPTDIQNANSVYDMKYGEGNKIPEDVFNDLTSGTQDVVDKYNKTIGKAETYSSAVKPSPEEENRYWTMADDKDSTLIGTEIAIYKIAEVYRDLVNTVDHAYALKMDENHWTLYPYGEQLMDYLAAQDGGAMVTDTTAEEVFANIKDQILYAIQSGSVTDVIGDNFDVAGLDSFKLTVGGVEVPGTVSGDIVTFDGGKYVVTYEPATDTTKEQFTWAINTPVESAKPVQLTYTVKLVNKSTEAGTHNVPTNEKATLTYTSTTGGEGSETFPVPTVTYTVTSPTPTTTPDTNTVTVTGTPAPDEHPDIADAKANGTWGQPTPTPAASSVIPQTSDDMPLVTLISAAGIAAAAVVVLVVMRRRRKQ